MVCVKIFSTVAPTFEPSSSTIQTCWPCSNGPRAITLSSRPCSRVGSSKISVQIASVWPKSVRSVRFSSMRGLLTRNKMDNRQRVNRRWCYGRAYRFELYRYGTRPSWHFSVAALSEHLLRKFDSFAPVCLMVWRRIGLFPLASKSIVGPLPRGRFLGSASEIRVQLPEHVDHRVILRHTVPLD